MDNDSPEYYALVWSAAEELVSLLNMKADEGLHPREWTMILITAIARLDVQESDDVKVEILRALSIELFPDSAVTLERARLTSSVN